MIAWTDLLAALALVMVIEGLMPFLNPNAMRNSMQSMINMDNATLRTAGFISMLLGVGLLYLVKN
jgi:uncharacterized protein YjeT (DUF2065 family)